MVNGGEPHGLTSYHVRRARGGEESSLEWVITRFTPLLRLQAEYRLKGSLRRLHDPEDLVDEVWVVALRRMGDLRARDGRWTPVLLKFLSSTLLHKVNNLLTRQLRNPLAGPPADRGTGSEPVTPVEQLPAAITSAVSTVQRRELLRAARDALEKLDAREREILILRGIEQIPNQDVARILEEKPGTVSKRYRRALDALRKELPGSLFDELPED